MKTPTIGRTWADLADLARSENWSHEEYLAAVLERQVADRESAGATMRIRTAHFPSITAQFSRVVDIEYGGDMTEVRAGVPVLLRWVLPALRRLMVVASPVIRLERRVGYDAVDGTQPRHPGRHADRPVPLLRRPVPDQVRDARADRHLPDGHGGRDAPRARDPQLRDPGVHAARSRTNQVFRQSFTWSDGFLHPGVEPGLGVEFDLKMASRYPYQRTYLPYNRLADGTVHDW